MKKIIIYNTILIIFIVSLLGGCSKNNETKMQYNNDVFTEKMYEQLVKINYRNGGTKIVVTDRADIHNIYNCLASLKLSETPTKDALNQKAGHMIFELVLKDEIISFGILSEEIIINGIRYQTDKDIVSDIRDQSLQNK